MSGAQLYSTRRMPALLALDNTGVLVERAALVLLVHGLLKSVFIYLLLSDSAANVTAAALYSVCRDLSCQCPALHRLSPFSLLRPASHFPLAFFPRPCLRTEDRTGSCTLRTESGFPTLHTCRPFSMPRPQVLCCQQEAGRLAAKGSRALPPWTPAHTKAPVQGLLRCPARDARSPWATQSLFYRPQTRNLLRQACCSLLRLCWRPSFSHCFGLHVESTSREESCEHTSH